MRLMQEQEDGNFRERDRAENPVNNAYLYGRRHNLAQTVLVSIYLAQALSLSVPSSFASGSVESLAQANQPWNSDPGREDSNSSSTLPSSAASSSSPSSPSSNPVTGTGDAASGAANTTVSPVADENAVKEVIEKARFQSNAGNLVEARQLLKQAIRTNPKDVQLLLEYYPICVKSNDWSDAVQTLEKIFALDPAKEKDLYAGYGEALYKLRRLDKAQLAFNKALDFGKDKELIHRTLIEIAKQQKNDLMAESEYAEYLKLKPNDGDMHFEYANTLYKLKKTKDALAHYKLASQLKPADAYVQEKLAFMLLSEKDYAGSIAAYRKAIQADPKNSARLAAALKYAREQQKAAAGQPAQPVK